MIPILPKVLHQVWVPGATRAPLPMPLARFVQRWRDLHPGWTHILWDEDSIGELVNQDLYDRAGEYVADHAIGQFRADLVRYEMLMRYGGVYADVDFEPLAPIDDLCIGPWVTESAARQGFLANGLMGMPPQHELMRRCVRGVRDRLEVSGLANQVSGPRLITPMAEGMDKLIIYPAEWFYPYRYDELDRSFDTDGCYAVHHWWHRRERKGRTGDIPCSS